MEKTMSLDHEWVNLMKEARDNGFTKEEIMDFLKNPQMFTNVSSFSPKNLVIK